MEKIHTLLWILFAIGAFVFRMIKKAQETSAQERRERPTRPGGMMPGLPTASFQELLQQMQARNSTAPASAPGPVAAPAAPPAAKRTLGGRAMPREVARPTRSQERTTARQISLEAPATARPRNAPAPPARRSSAMPRASSEATNEGFGPSVGRSPATISNTVRQWLSQPESVRAAFVLSEIFQRKYE